MPTKRFTKPAKNFAQTCTNTVLADIVNGPAGNCDACVTPIPREVPIPVPCIGHDNPLPSILRLQIIDGESSTAHGGLRFELFTDSVVHSEPSLPASNPGTLYRTSIVEYARPDLIPEVIFIDLSDLTFCSTAIQDRTYLEPDSGWFVSAPGVTGGLIPPGSRLPPYVFSDVGFDPTAGTNQIGENDPLQDWTVNVSVSTNQISVTVTCGAGLRIVGAVESGVGVWNTWESNNGAFVILYNQDTTPHTEQYPAGAPTAATQWQMTVVFAVNPTTGALTQTSLTVTGGTIGGVIGSLV